MLAEHDVARAADAHLMDVGDALAWAMRVMKRAQDKADAYRR